MTTLTRLQRRSICHAIDALKLQRQKFAPEANLARKGAPGPEFERARAAYDSLSEDIDALKAMLKIQP